MAVLTYCYVTNNNKIEKDDNGVPPYLQNLKRKVLLWFIRSEDYC